MGCFKLAYHSSGVFEKSPVFLLNPLEKHAPASKNRLNYSPFGMTMPGRNYNSSEYRYGFQNQEKDDEIKGEGNSVNYEYRMHDPRIGRFFAVDPLMKKYPFYSPYAFSGNRVIDAVELEGLEPSEVNLSDAKADETYQGSNKQTGANPNLIYNWKLNVSSFENNDGTKTESRSWEMGSQYTGPTKDEAANIANAVYNVSNGTARKGDEAGNTLYRLTNGVNTLGFSAGVYEREIDGVKFNVMAFAGTDDGYDAVTDAGQAFNLPDYQFAFAAKFGDLAKGKKNFTFIGHSLGGALAALASARSGQPAITFNAPGLSTGTKLTYKAFNFKKIDAYIIRGEILNTTLIPLGQGANGNRHFQNGQGSKISKHGINNFL